MFKINAQVTIIFQIVYFVFIFYNYVIITYLLVLLFYFITNIMIQTESKQCLKSDDVDEYSRLIGCVSRNVLPYDPVQEFSLEV